MGRQGMERGIAEGVVRKGVPVMSRRLEIPAEFNLDSEWARVPLRYWGDVLDNERRDLVACEEWRDNSAIDITAVVGTMHPDYADGSWVDLLCHGKRMTSNLALFKTNPGYYTDTARKVPVMDYVSLDGEHWFIGGDGNHRTCIARFAFAGDDRQFLLKGVSTTTFTIDTEMREAVDTLRHAMVKRRVAADIRPERTHVGREDGPGWRRDRYRIVVAMNIHGHGRIALDRDALLAARDMLEGEPRFKRYLPGYRLWLVGRLRRLARSGEGA